MIIGIQQISPDKEAYGFDLQRDLTSDNHGKVEHIVRGSMVAHQGEIMFPPPRCDPPPVAEAAATIETVEEDPIVVARKRAVRNSGLVGGSYAGMLAMGGSATVPWLNLGLSTWIGSQLVRGVLPALHSPLMAVTNAISGLTVVGGLVQLNGTIALNSAGAANGLALVATGISAVNIGGGFVVAQRMLDLFKRPSDPPEFQHYLLLPTAAGGAALIAVGQSGIPLDTAIQNGAIGLSGAALYCLSTQQTARFGNCLAMTGVGLGLGTTLADIYPDANLLTQGGIAIGAGAALGFAKGRAVDLQDLPQTVALFHSFVGVAASMTCISHYIAHLPTDGMSLTTGFLGTWVGGVTATGSIVAYKKLSGTMDGGAINPPGGKITDVAMLGGSAATLGYMLTNDITSAGPMTGVACLMVPTVTSALSGWRLAKAVGGADMPVIITTLNSSSGWALAAEGVLMNNNLLTGVGCFIGSSGAFLSHHMCKYIPY